MPRNSSERSIADAKMLEERLRLGGHFEEAETLRRIRLCAIRRGSSAQLLYRDNMDLRRALAATTGSAEATP